jgi:hypothetical protein
MTDQGMQRVKSRAELREEGRQRAIWYYERLTITDTRGDISKLAIYGRNECRRGLDMALKVAEADDNIIAVRERLRRLAQEGA